MGRASPGSTPFGAESRVAFRVKFERQSTTSARGVTSALSSPPKRGSSNLGLKLKGEQLAAGVRFVQLVKEGAYDLVVGNPPYLGRKRAESSTDWSLVFPKQGSEDLCTAFMVRGAALTRRSGEVALLGVRSWIFLEQYEQTRNWVFDSVHLHTIGDIDRGGFESLAAGPAGIAVSMCVFRRTLYSRRYGVAIRAYSPDDLSGAGITDRRRAGLLSQSEVYRFEQGLFKCVPGSPVLYHWDKPAFLEYEQSSSVGDAWDVKYGSITGDDVRFLRRVFEVHPGSVLVCREDIETPASTDWSPYIKGADGATWFEPLSSVVRWKCHGLEPKARNDYRFGSYSRLIQNEAYNYRLGVAFTATGATFGARAHVYASVVGAKGRSVFGAQRSSALCLLNSSDARRIAADLNPTIDFNINDVKRLPARAINGADEIFGILVSEWLATESHRETSVDYLCPGPSPWRHAQDWAQAAVDRPEGARLPPYEPEFEPESPADRLSSGLGVALGRFGANGEGILDPVKDGLSAALPSGMCFLDGSLEKSASGDSLGHSAAELLHAEWAEYGASVDPDTDLRTWLRLRFFGDVHRGMYENRPIYFPLSSEKKTFVAYVSIHRWTADTLRALLAEHLHPALTHLEGEIVDLRESRRSSDKKIAREAERRYDQVAKWKQELDDFIAQVEHCAEKGPPPPDAKTTEREIGARYAPDLDDGVMINSAALWPLLEPQWKDPKKWWKEVASSKGKKDYDWAHLAARYFPSRVDQKCQEDPSLGVAHGCFWKYHPQTAYKWELRLQDEIAPDFTIDEEGSDAFRAAFETDHPDKAEELVVAEKKRRERKKKQQAKEAGSAGPLFDATQDGAAAGSKA